MAVFSRELHGMLIQMLMRMLILFWVCSLLLSQAEAKHIAACQTLINAQSGGENLADAVRSAFDEKEALVHAEAAAKAIAEKNKVAKDFDARLQALVNRKADEENKAYKVLVDSVYEEVLAAVASDSKFKKVRLLSVVRRCVSVMPCGVGILMFLLRESTCSAREDIVGQ